MVTIPKIAKGLLIGAIAGVGSLVTALQDNGVSNQEVAIIALATLSALGGYFGVSHPDAEQE